MTLKTGLMAAENSSLHFLTFLISKTKFDQINAALVGMIPLSIFFFNLTDPKPLSGSV